MNASILSLRPWRQALTTLGALAALVAVLHGCGGGVEGQGTGSVSYSDGPISGFGSIIVNGVHFDESQATITDDDGHGLSSADLKLGMTVRVDAGAIDRARGTAVATAVHVGSDLVGPVSANDLASSTVTVLGQPVRVTASTVFDDALAGGQAAIAVGSQIEVFAILDPVSGVYAARRIEPAGAPAAYTLRGLVAQLDKTQRTLQIGTAPLAYSAGTAPGDLANGQIVRATLQTAPDGNGRWVVTRFANGASRPPEGGETEIESVIASYTSNADFTLSGVRVNASGAAIEPAGAVLAAGVRVEVEGSYRGGVLVARKVEVKGSGGDGGDDSGGGREIELDGRISALDTTANTFVLRGETVDYSTATFKGGATEDQLVALPKVHIKGRLGDDGSTVIAEELEIDD